MIDIGSRVVVTKGNRKVPIDTEGTVFWKKQYFCKDHTFGYTRIGIKTDDGNKYFVPMHNTKIVKEKYMKTELDWSASFIAVLVKGEEKIPVLFTKEFGVFPLYKAIPERNKYGVFLGDAMYDISEYEVTSPKDRDEFMELVNSRTLEE